MSHLHHQDALSSQTFTVCRDGACTPLVITRNAKNDFENSGLEAMDEVLIALTERLTPANAPGRRPVPLDLVGRMLVDAVKTGNGDKLMLCALWMAHHYPSVTGMECSGPVFSFTRNRKISSQTETNN